MTPSTSKIADLLVPIVGEWDVMVIRADGSVERKTLLNAVTAAGLNRIANRAVQASGTTPFYVIGVGTQISAASVTDTQAQLGEVLRKAFIAQGAFAQSREWIFGVSTFQGFADGITSVNLQSAGIFDHLGSGGGIMGNRVNSLNTILADSDYLSLRCRIRVGSHNLTHSN